MILPPPNPKHLHVLQPGERGSNSNLWSSRRNTYVRKNIQMRSMEAKIRDAMIRREAILFKPAFIKTDLTLRTYGRLVVMRCVGVDASRRAWWAVVCTCGNVDIVRGQTLKAGKKTALRCCNKSTVAHG